MRSGQIVYQFEGYLLIKDNKEFLNTYAEKNIFGQF